MQVDPDNGSTRPAAEVADEPRGLVDERLHAHQRCHHERRKRLGGPFFDFFRRMARRDTCIRDTCSTLEQIRRETGPDLCVLGNGLALALEVLSRPLTALACGGTLPALDALSMPAARCFVRVSTPDTEPVLRAVLLPPIAGRADTHLSGAGLAGKHASRGGDGVPSPGAG